MSFKCWLCCKSSLDDGLYGEPGLEASSLDVAFESVLLNVATPLKWNKQNNSLIKKKLKNCIYIDMKIRNGKTIRQNILKKQIHKLRKQHIEEQFSKNGQ